MLPLHIKVLSLETRTVLPAFFPFFQIICEVYFRNRHQLLHSFSLTSSNARKVYICENHKRRSEPYPYRNEVYKAVWCSVLPNNTLPHPWRHITNADVDSWYHNSCALLILTLSIFEVVVLVCVLPERGSLSIDSWSSLKGRYQNFIWTILIELFRKYNSLRI